MSVFPGVEAADVDHDRELARAVRRGAARVDWFCRFLGSASPRPGRRVIHEARPLGQGNVAYGELALRHGTEFVALRKSGGLLANIDCYDEVTVISGHCLFGSSSLYWRTPSGLVPGTDILNGEHDQHIAEPVLDILVDRRPSLYELEACNRLSRIVAALAREVEARASLRIVLCQPRTHYYISLVESYAHGVLTLEQFRYWLDLVDERCRADAELFMDGLDSYSAQSGSEKLRVRVTDGFGDLDPAIRAELAAGVIPDPASLLARLAGQDPAWSRLAAVSTVSGWSELRGLGYVADYLRASFATRGGPRRLLIAVEDPAERRIFGSMANAVPRIRQVVPDAVHHVVALYPLDRVVISVNGERVRTYHHDPGQEMIGPDGRLVGPRELVRALCPAGAVDDDRSIAG